MWFGIWIFGVFCGVTITVILAACSVSGEESRKEEKRDPCMTCPRWWECNGVDQDNCPLWEDRRDTGGSEGIPKTAEETGLADQEQTD